MLEQKTPIHIEHDRSGFKEYMYQNFYAPNLKPSPLKSLEICEKEAHKQVDDAYDLFINSLVDGEDLFLEVATPQEKEQLEKIIHKAEKAPATNSEVTGEALIEIQPVENDEEAVLTSAFNLEELDFLEKMAKRELAENRFENSSLMFRWILLFVPTYSPALVGAAISEQQLNHIDDAKNLFLLGIEALPNDYYLHQYAADFFVTIQDVAKAKEILINAQNGLKEEKLETSDDYKAITERLAGL